MADYNNNNQNQSEEERIESARAAKARRDHLAYQTGIGRLSSYIPANKFNDLLEWSAQGMPDGGSITPARERQIDCAVEICKYLDEQGYDFEIQKDRNPQQLMAKLTDKNISIRLTDIDASSHLIGRTHNDGVTYRIKDGNKITPVVTPEVAVAVVKYGLGDSVQRLDSAKMVGVPDFRDTNLQQSDVYNVKKGNNYKFTAAVGKGQQLKELPDGSLKIETAPLSVYVESNRTASANVKRFSDETDYATKTVVKTGAQAADEFLTDAYNSAVNNCIEAMKFDALDKASEEYHKHNCRTFPEFSAEGEPVTNEQRSYYMERMKIFDDAELSDEERTEKLAQLREDTVEKITNQFGSISTDENGHQRVDALHPVYVGKFMNTSRGSMNNENDLLSALKKLQSSGDEREIVGDDYVCRNFQDKMVMYDPSTARNISPADKESFSKLSPFWQHIGQTVNDSMLESGIGVKSINVDDNGVIHYEGVRIVGEKTKTPEPVIGDIGQVFEPNEKGLIKTNYNSCKPYEKEVVDEETGETKIVKNPNENFYIAPGYTATVIPPEGSHANESFVDRVRLKGYEQNMAQAIRNNIRQSVIQPGVRDDVTALNVVYRQAYKDTLPLDYEERWANEGKTPEVADALIKSKVSRVTFGQELASATNVMQKQKYDKDYANGNATVLESATYKGFKKTNGNMLACMPSEELEYAFDTRATGTGSNQGTIMYLTEDAKVDPDSGKLTRGKSKQMALMASEEAGFKYSEFNSVDRTILSLSNAMNQNSTAMGRTQNLDGEEIKPIGIGTAHMSLGGYTQDDAFPVSKEFAESNMVRGDDGELRPLRIGDKICDFSGNKGVISVIVDRNMDMSYFEEKPITDDMSEKERQAVEKENYVKRMQSKVVQVFKDNPSLDVIGAPYTGPSRFNGGTARELIDSQEKAKAAAMPTTLNLDGKEIDGGIGYAKWIVTKMSVDSKTHVYEDEDDGRKASGQLIWGLAEAGAHDVIREMYSNNGDSLTKLREMLILTGYDISQTGEIHKGYEAHIIGAHPDDPNKPLLEQRKEYSIRDIHSNNLKMPDAADVEAAMTGAATKNSRAKLYPEGMRKDLDKQFDTLMGKDGGFMNLPFPVKLPNGEETEPVPCLDADGNPIMKPDGTSAMEYRLPILPGRYRSGRETIDKQPLKHEYTNIYKDIYDAACDYLNAEYVLAAPDALKAKDANKKAEAAQAQAISTVQSKYDDMCDDIIERQFSGKHNVFKDDIMCNHLAKSATAVISPDPTLDLDEVLMPKSMAETLGIDGDEDPRVLTWRDPVLSAGGIRYLKVGFVETREGYPGYDENNPMNTLTGVAINPSTATSYEGDFDGDSIGICALQTQAAKDSAMRTLSPQAQFLNREMDARGEHSAYFQEGLDVAAGVYADKQKNGDRPDSIENQMKEAVAMANEADKNHDSDVTPGSLNAKAFELYNNAQHRAHETSFGESAVSYESPIDHINSLVRMTESGAKGSLKKLDDYAKQFGVECEWADVNDKAALEALSPEKREIAEKYRDRAIANGDNHYTLDFKDYGHTLAGEKERMASLSATHAKDCLTGSAGKSSQHASMLGKNNTNQEILDHEGKPMVSLSQATNALTHPVTQSVMQLKHDSADVIMHKIDMVVNIAPAIWAGQKVEERDGTWKLVTDDKGNTTQMTPDEWKDTMTRFLKNDSGLGTGEPNPEYIEIVAKAMTVKENGVDVIRGYDPKTRTVASGMSLDSAAYEASGKKTLESLDGVNIFEKGHQIDNLTACNDIRRNQKIMEQPIEERDYSKMRAFTSKDSQMIARNGKVAIASIDLIDAVGKAKGDFDFELEVPDFKTVTNSFDKQVADTTMALANATKSMSEPQNVQQIHQSVAEKAVEEAEAAESKSAANNTIRISPTGKVQGAAPAVNNQERLKQSNLEMNNAMGSAIANEYKQYAASKIMNGEQPSFTSFVNNECRDRPQIVQYVQKMSDEKNIYEKACGKDVEAYRKSCEARNLPFEETGRALTHFRREMSNAAVAINGFRNDPEAARQYYEAAIAEKSAQASAPATPVAPVNAEPAAKTSSAVMPTPNGTTVVHSAVKSASSEKQDANPASPQMLPKPENASVATYQQTNKGNIRLAKSQTELGDVSSKSEAIKQAEGSDESTKRSPYDD